MNNLICIVGPTASGKTSLAVRLAQAFETEIISADSMQIYKHMNIGTAKPTLDEMGGIRHHMIDIIDPGQTYSAAQYAVDAGKCADEICARGIIPIVAGGSGLYLDSLIGTLQYEPEPEHDDVRTLLYAKAEEEGTQAMHEQLRSIDPDAAEHIHQNDRRRILRALEIYMLTGEKPSVRTRRAHNYPRRFNALKIGLSWPRDELYKRINMRVDKMFDDGLVEEARMICAKYPSSTSGQAIGYKELFAYFEGKCSLEEAKENIARESRRYAKRQISWLSRDGQVIFVDAQDTDALYKCVFNMVRDFVTFCNIF